jgi:hypothetical protein
MVSRISFAMVMAIGLGASLLGTACSAGDMEDPAQVAGNEGAEQELRKCNEDGTCGGSGGDFPDCAGGGLYDSHSGSCASSCSSSFLAHNYCSATVTEAYNIWGSGVSCAYPNQFYKRIYGLCRCSSTPASSSTRC